MQYIAALIEFPDVNPIALAGVCLVALSLLFGLFSNYYFKRSHHSKELSKLQWKGVHDIFDDKKLSHEEVSLIEKVLARHNIENPLHAVTTRDGFGKCIHAEMTSILEGTNDSDLREMGIRLRDIRNALGLDYIPVGKPIYSSREIHIGQDVSIATDQSNHSIWHDMIVQDVDEAYLSHTATSF